MLLSSLPLKTFIVPPSELPCQGGSDQRSQKVMMCLSGKDRIYLRISLNTSLSEGPVVGVEFFG